MPTGLVWFPNSSACTVYELGNQTTTGWQMHGCVWQILWVSGSDTTAFFAELDKKFLTTTDGVLVGDFNMLQTNRFLCSKGKFFYGSTLGLCQALIDYHNLILINKEPTKK